MPNDIAHFAIHADDCARAKRFYESVFGWRFEPWGPPNFWRIFTSDRGGAVHGALQQRRAPVQGRGMIGYECTVSVDDINAIAAAVTKAGGTVQYQPFVIEQVGTLIQFTDTEGNIVNAMQYLQRP